MYIALECLQCSVDKLLELTGPLDEPSIAFICYRALLGLVYIHGRRELHRDIKPGNVLLSLGADGRCDAKLADFGLLATLDQDNETAKSYVGTFVYMSPERIMGDPYTSSCDIWSLGLTLLTCACGEYPLSNSGHLEVMGRLSQGPALIGTLKTQHSAELKSLVASCLALKPEERPSAQTLLAHPFFAAQRSTSSPLSSATPVLQQALATLHTQKAKQRQDELVKTVHALRRDQTVSAGASSRSGRPSGGTGKPPRAASAGSVRSTRSVDHKDAVSPPTPALDLGRIAAAFHEDAEVVARLCPTKVQSTPKGWHDPDADF